MLYVNPVAVGNTTGINLAKDPEAKQKMALQELEHFFLFTLLQEMRKSIPVVEGEKAGPEGDFYNEMLDDALSGQMSKSGQLGIAKSIEEQLRTVEVQQEIRRTLAERDAEARRRLAVKVEGISSDK